MSPNTTPSTLFGRFRREIAGFFAAAALSLPLAAGATVIDFDSGDGVNLAAVGNDYEGSGVQFGANWVYYADDGANGTGGLYPAASDPNSAWSAGSRPGHTTIIFSEPVTFVGFWYNNGAGFAATFNAWPGMVPNVGSCVLCDEILSSNVPNGPTYVSYTPAQPIQSIAFFSANDLTIDNLEFRTAVPEPGTLLLLGLGLSAVAGLRRRRN